MVATSQCIMLRIEFVEKQMRLRATSNNQHTDEGISPSFNIEFSQVWTVLGRPDVTDSKILASQFGVLGFEVQVLRF